MGDNSPTSSSILTERAKSLQRQFVSFNNIKPRLEGCYLVRDWLSTGGLSILYGPSNSGKTFVASDLAAHVASGCEWRGNRVRSGAVIYVAAEGGSAIYNRFAAIRQSKEELHAHAGLYLLTTQLDLFGPVDAKALCSSMPVATAELIVIDTMARSMGAGDENSAKDINQFIRNCDFIREYTGAHVLIVHHSGKKTESGARGSSALRAAVDTEIVISDRQIACAKQRDMEIPLRLFFDLQSVELGVDQDGKPVTSAVVVPMDAPTMKPKPLSGRVQVAVRALDVALRLRGAERRGENLPPDRKVVKISEWRDQCQVNGLTNPQATADAQRKAFTRAMNQLVDSGRIRVWEEFVWREANDD
ncbi:MAG: AAA family ATPase [Paracoccaceae bacterium]